LEIWSAFEEKQSFGEEGIAEVIFWREISEEISSESETIFSAGIEKIASESEKTLSLGIWKVASENVKIFEESETISCYNVSEEEISIEISKIF